MKRFPTSSAFAFFLITVLFLFINSGCFKNFYSTNTQPGLNDSAIAEIKNSHKYFIVHLKNGDYALKDIMIKDSMLTAQLGQVTMDHMDWLSPEPGSSPSYHKKDGPLVLNEIHIYALSQMPEDSTHLSIPISSITRVDLYEKNISKTKTNHALSTAAAIIIPIGIFVAVVAIACNCPQVYAYDGNQYQFKSGIFSGAIYSSLEKTDYLPLDNLRDVKGKYMFQVMNTQQEEQFINRLQLISIHHDASVQVLLDRNGNMHTYREVVSPEKTSLKNDQQGLTFKLRDGNNYIFDQKTDGNSRFGNVILTFDKPSNTQQAKLIVHAKNSMWAGYVFDEFSSLFGDQFQNFQIKQDRAKRQSLEQWQMEQAIPLMVYVETNKGWELTDYFPTTGNTAGRDMIMAIKIPESTQNKIRIKLESAFMFWELDFIAMDFSPDLDLKAERINVSAAINSNQPGNEIAQVISKDDQYSKLLQNEYLNVEFNAQVNFDPQSSYFLVSTGYYHSLKQYAGKADISQLKYFKKPGSFSKFSEYKFDETKKQLARGIELRTNPN
jgi:hypothetical protein